MKKRTHVAQALTYFMLCIASSLWAGYNEPTAMKMTFFIFGFAYFCFGFLSYFYPMANFTHSHQIYERQNLKPKRLNIRRVQWYGYTGFLASLTLLWLLFQRP